MSFYHRLPRPSGLRSQTAAAHRAAAASRDIPHDVRLFLDDYPDNEDDIRQSRNLQFYSNERRSRPDHVRIEEIHKRWKGDYAKLEYKHGYIQWIFPIQEYGMNNDAQPLQRHEIMAMRADNVILDRVLKSYRMMLDFFGMRLVSDETGLLARAEPERKNIEQYRNLVRASHNNLRISRIMKSLSEFNLEHLNAGFVLHVLNEQSEFDELNTPRIQDSMDRWWANCNRRDDEREWIGELIREVRTNERFVFTRAMYERALENRRTTGRLSFDEPTTPPPEVIETPPPPVVSP